MYFQACSNSAYPQHSGEQYRTIGPLVIFSLIVSDNSDSKSKYILLIINNDNEDNIVIILIIIITIILIKETCLN